MKNNELTLFIDLDGTVYDKYNGIWEEMSNRIDQFINKSLEIPEDEIVDTREKYYDQYGSTLRGLQIHHHIDPEDYLAYVHDLDLNKYLTLDPDLRYNLKSIPYPKWIFTNSDRNHTQRVLQAIGIEDLFEGILDVREMSFIPKPDKWTYEHALEVVGSPDPRSCIFVDDTHRNLDPAKAMGWQTVWVESSVSQKSSSHVIPKLHYLPNVIDQIEIEVWFNKMSRHKTPSSRQPMIVME